MNAAFHTSFKQEFQKLSKETQEIFYGRLRLLGANRRHPYLQNSAVGRNYPGCRSIHITGNIRALYVTDGESIIFILIGTHAELYG